MRISNGGVTSSIEPLGNDSQPQDSNSSSEATPQTDSFFNTAAIANQAEILNPKGDKNQTSTLAQDEAVSESDLQSVNSTGAAAGSEGTNNSPWSEGELINLSSGNDYRVVSVSDIADYGQQVRVERVNIDEDGNVESWEKIDPFEKDNFGGDIPLGINGNITILENGLIEHWSMELVAYPDEPGARQVVTAIHTSHDHPEQAYETFNGRVGLSFEVVKAEKFEQDLNELVGIAKDAIASGDEETGNTLPEVPPVLTPQENDSDPFPKLPEVIIPDPNDIGSFVG